MRGDAASPGVALEIAETNDLCALWLAIMANKRNPASITSKTNRNPPNAEPAITETEVDCDPDA